MKWDSRYLELAKLIASWSKDPSTQCGAVLVDRDNRIVSTGFNGFPQGIEDSEERLNDRETKYEMVLHAEQNAILFARRDLYGCTLYTWPYQPCSRCAAMIVQSGIHRVVSTRNVPARWQKSFELANTMFSEAYIDTEYVGE